MGENLGYRNLINRSKQDILEKFKDRDEYYQYLYARVLAFGENIELPSISLTESGFRLDKITSMLIEDDVLYIPEGITIIANDASSCLSKTDRKRVKKIIFNDELKTIGAYSFYDYENLESLEFNNGLCEISSNSFSISLIKTLNIPGTVKNVYVNICDKTNVEEYILNYGSQKFLLKSYYSASQIRKLWLPPTILPVHLGSLSNLLEIHVFNKNNLGKFYIDKNVKIIVEKDGWGNWREFKKKDIENRLSKLYKKIERYEKINNNTMLNKTNEHINSLKNSLEEL